VTTAICPACGYPTLGPDLCAFCRPEVRAGDQPIGQMPSATEPRPGSSEWGYGTLAS